MTKKIPSFISLFWTVGLGSQPWWCNNKQSLQTLKVSSSCAEQSTNWILKQKKWGYTIVLAKNLISKLPSGTKTKRIFENTVQRIIVWSLFQAQNLHCAPFSDDKHLSFHRQSQALCLMTPNAFLEIRWACREQDAAQSMSSHGGK